MTLGCSESEVSIAVSKMPKVLELSDKNIGCKIEFLINEAAMEPQYIVERPVLLTFSLEKRLVPRHYVMKVLQEKELLNSNTNFFTITKLGDETFKLKFIDCHKDSVPGLADTYAGIVSSKVKF
jgi:mTERF domain-containing protein